MKRDGPRQSLESDEEIGNSTGEQSRMRTLDSDPDPFQAGLAVTVIAAVGTIVAALFTTPLPGLVEENGATISVGLGTMVLWILYAAHGVPILLSSPEWSFSAPLIASPVVHIIPPLVLFAGGFGIVRMFGATSLISAIQKGATIVVGYLLLMGGGLFIATFSIDAAFASLTVRPDPVWAIAAGIIFPVLFGGVGGAVGYVIPTIGKE